MLSFFVVCIGKMVPGDGVEGPFVELLRLDASVRMLLAKRNWWYDFCQNPA